MTQSKNRFRTAALLILLAFSAAACAPAAPANTPAPILKTAQVTREITQVVTQEVTVEVTQVVEVPVTNTPTPILETATPTLTPTRTRIPSATPTWSPPRVEVVSAPGTEKSACWYGPSTGYLYKYGLPDGVWMRVIGRNEEGSWVAVKAGDDPDSNACWIQTQLVKFLQGTIADVPVLWIALPYSVLYKPPTAVSTNRVGDEVTIFWQPIWMTEDDYRGYMVEAWVCQGGRQVFRPIGYVTSYTDNQLMIARKGIIAVKVVDEPGCDMPSRARLYAVEKHGYTNYVMVPWPQATANP
jgi:hypothetical protein